jgi:starch-binding outer membrane protein SusE/F
MKKIFQLLAFSVFVAGISSCEKTEKKDFYEGGTAPALTASAATVSLEPGQEANTALVLNWTNSDYKFTTGTSSQDVTYTVEMDTLGANFASSKKVSSVIAKDLTKSYTVGELNNILGNDMLLQLNPRRNYTLQVRVISSIGSSVKLTSNVISYTTKPFQPPPKVEPPTNSTLWIVGDAPTGPPTWSNPVPAPYDVSFRFTKLSNTLYELASVPMSGAGGYKLIQEQGVWGTQYHMVTGTWNAGNFEKKDSDPQFPGPPTAGNYKITVDFQLGKYTVIKL